jgi:hypothetical protein
MSKSNTNQNTRSGNSDLREFLAPGDKKLLSSFPNINMPGQTIDLAKFLMDSKQVHGDAGSLRHS